MFSLKALRRGVVTLSAPKSSFKASDLKIIPTTSQSELPPLNESLAFGKHLADHMVDLNWSSETGWKQPVIKSQEDLEVDAASGTLHHAVECFEGMKAYKREDGQILLFRPHMNMERLRRSAHVLCLPDFDGEELLQCLNELLKLDSRWIPQKKGYSLYIRPNYMGMNSMLDISKPLSAKLFIINSIVGPYYPTGFQAVSLYCDDNIARAYPGGLGQYKIGANYAGSILHSERVIREGYQQVLWLIKSYVTEVGTMNLFVFWKNEEGEEELITAPLDGTILPGVTRDSVLSLAREWKQFKVSEKKFTIHELTKAIDEDRVIEIFGCGTAAVVSPVGKFFYQGKDYHVPLALGNAGKLTMRIWESLTDIQYGYTDHEWSYLVR